ncbi:MAG: hypothetical protein UZ21_OP11001001105 [Microgenomates bacterium OLB22]|nr:MAG: hypothetical protein UZ21_OP11001001105 [Microgenomates bacterium OLB22]
MKKIMAIDVIEQIFHEIQSNKPSGRSLLDELTMMKFQIRAVSGDLSSLVPMRSYFFSSLWDIGTIDHIVQDHIYDMDDQEQERLLSFLEHFEDQTSLELQANSKKKRRRRSSTY